MRQARPLSKPRLVPRHNSRYRNSCGIIHAVEANQMKPTAASVPGQKRFPATHCSFHSGIGEWRGYSSPYDDDERSGFRNFHNLTREFLIESARERRRELVVFGAIVITAAWPVIYMLVIVIKLLLRGRPL